MLSVVILALRWAEVCACSRRAYFCVSGMLIVIILLLERVALFEGSVKFVLLESVFLPRREGRGIKTGCCRAQ